MGENNVRLYWQIFGNRRLKVSCVDIEHLFKMSARQRTWTGRQICRRLEKETECDQDLSRTLIFSCFRREFSCLCGWNVMSFAALPMFSHPGRFTSLMAASRPCQSRTSVYCLDIIMSFYTVSVEYYWIVNIYRNSAWLFTLNFWLLCLFCITISLSAQPIHQMNFWILHHNTCLIFWLKKL